MAASDPENTLPSAAPQEVRLSDGRRLVRHRRGLSLLEGEAPSTPESAPARLSRTPVRASPTRTVVVGHTAARRLAEQLSGAVFAEPAVVAIGDAEVVVVWLEGSPYAELFELERRYLAAGVASLFVTCDPDGLRIGPLTVAGVSPCFVCAQLAGLRVLGLPAAELVAAAAGFHTLPLEAEADFALACQVVGAELAALAASVGAPELLGEVVWRTTTGAVRRYPVARAADCPLCSGLEPRATPLVARAESVLVESLERRPRRAVGGDEGLVRRVGIVGGGTAGYLTALALRAKLPHLDVTLIESSAVPVIGVGEATTPLMPQFLHVDLGLDVHQLLREVEPTLKLGIRFEWGAPQGFFNYPFGKLDTLEPYVYDGDVLACSLRSLLMAAGKVPIDALDTRTAYHLDNERFVAYLARRAEERGVARIDARIIDVEKSPDGEEVAALVADDGRRFSFDLHLDCSGFRALLLEGALGSPFHSWAASLPTDMAVVAAVPHDGQIKPYTVAETMSAGWCWNTPQVAVDHRGYVFCSAFQSPDEAAEEMRAKNPGMGDHRLVRFRAGRHEHFMKGNVVALGNAYGFVEPLESTALHMLIRQIGMLAQAFPLRRGERGIADLLNLRVGAFWDYLGWFLALHYRFNQRLETSFWRHCRAEVDVSRHTELLETFRERGPLSYDPALAASFPYPDPLWGAEGVDLILLGQRVPARLPRPRMERAAWQERRRLAERVALRAPEQSAALALLRERPELLERFVASLRDVGPAFEIAPRGGGR